MKHHKKVSAETVTGITGTPEFAGHALPPQPTRDELVAKIRKGLEKTLHEKKAAATGKNTTSEAFRIANAEGMLTRFEALLQNPPDGFDLVPVYYVRAPAHRKEEVLDEYSFNVRPRFLRHLAVNHAKELAALGLCAHAIGRMREGLDPLRADGAYYSVSIDHIVERSGSGTWASTRLRDPHDPEHEADVSPVNHFRNLILLPEHVHQAKNTLNHLQISDKLEEGEGRWVLMLVPSTKHTSGFVAAPQKAGLGCATPTIKDMLSNTGYIAMQAARMVKMLRQNQGVSANLTTLSALAHARGKDLAQAANDNIVQNNPANSLEFGGTFAEAFEQTLRLNPHLHKRAHELVRPALRDVAASLRLLFNEIMGQYHDQCHNKEKSEKSLHDSRDNLDSFLRFYHSKPLNALRKDTRLLPFPEAAQLRQMFNKIDENLQKHGLDAPPHPVKKPKTQKRPHRAKHP